MTMDNDLAVMMARLEGKMDLVLERTEATSATLASHIEEDHEVHAKVNEIATDVAVLKDREPQRSPRRKMVISGVGGTGLGAALLALVSWLLDLVKSKP